MPEKVNKTKLCQANAGRINFQQEKHINWLAKKLCLTNFTLSIHADTCNLKPLFFKNPTLSCSNILSFDRW